MLLLLWPLLRFYFYFCYCCRRRRCCFEMETRVDVDFGERREAAEGRGGVNGVVVGSHRGSAEGGREGGGMVVVVVESAAVVMVLDASARHCFRCTICNALVIQQWFSVRRSQRLRVKFAVAVQRGERC